MSSFLKFLEKVARHCGMNFKTEKLHGNNEHELAANVLTEINIYLYQKKETLPSEYISEFHKYWEGNHENE
ncbi:MAG: hypothetical protein ABIH42_03445 [Planctomycetota bacterium]